MTTPELIKYVKNETDKGVARNVITDNLKTQGWTDRDIVEVYNIINQVPTNKEETIRKAFRISKKTIITILSLVIFLFVLFGFFYASGYFLKSNNLFSRFSNSAEEIKSLSYDIDFKFDASDLKIDNKDMIYFGDSSSKVYNFTGVGSADFSNKDNLKFQNTFSFKVGEIEGSIDVKMINKNIYLNIVKAPEIGFISLSSIENKWISIPIEAEMSEMIDNSLASGSPFSSSIFSELTDEQEKELIKIFNNATLIKIKKRHLPEMIDGSLTYHINFDLDKEGLVKFMKEIELFVYDLNGEELQDTFSDNNYEEIFDNLKNFNGEIWVGVFDNLPRKLNVSFEGYNPKEPTDGILKFNISARYYNWNKPIIIEKPEKSVNFEEFTHSIMGEMVGGNFMGGQDENNSLVLSGKNDDAKIKTILLNLNAYGKMYYDSSKIGSYKGFCKTKSGDFSDYGVSELVITLPSGSSFKCIDSVSEWVAWAKLSNNNYWCSDSSGYLSELKNIPNGTSCIE